ncbi:hypothetical protein ACS8E9_11760 [Pseudomonas neustonica]|uniref:hypothetical protein n=1 Tax=Pseudomonas neustonica TaxID=2487346 RepID=UPI003F481110
MKMGAFLLTCLLFSGLVRAETDEAKMLIQGCAEVEAIYNRRGEKNLLAGINTSVAEALRAGYCRGVLEQYRRSGGCYQNDWVRQAQRIGQESNRQSLSINALLRRSCG